MTATYTFDIFASLDGCASHHGDWGGYWGKQGPELLEHRANLYDGEQRIVFGANTYRLFQQFRSGPLDPWVARMLSLPTTVVSSSLTGPDQPNVSVAAGDGVEIVRRLKEESDLPLRSHGSLSLNRALMAAGLVDQVQVTIFPALAGATGEEPVFRGGADFDLELLSARTLDGRTQELVYRPTLHG